MFHRVLYILFVTTIALSQRTSPPSPQKPGVCPDPEPGTGGVCANMCKNDFECEGDKKCCGNACGGTACVPPENRLFVKPGACPLPELSEKLDPSVCFNDCVFDGECPGEEKCCISSSGDTKCLKPVKSNDDGTPLDC